MIGAERIPREKDPEQIARMMDPNACRMESDDDAWHCMTTFLSSTQWRGVRVLKNQFDLRRYFDLISALRPGFVVETGLQHGGSAIFFMDVLSHFGVEGLYVGIDLDCLQLDPAVLDYDYPHAIIRRDCLHPETVATVHRLRQESGAHRALFILDSVHSYEHVKEELRLYAPLVPVGSYLVVEDTDHSGRPVLANYKPSAAEAVDEFVAEHPEFVRDEALEGRYGKWTNSPGGWLQRIAACAGRRGQLRCDLEPNHIGPCRSGTFVVASSSARIGGTPFIAEHHRGGPGTTHYEGDGCPGNPPRDF